MTFDKEAIQQKLKELFSSKNFLKSLFLVLSLLAIILLLTAILFKSFKEEKYGVLYTHLSPDDAGKILSVLQEEKIPYKIEGDGSIILVPRKKVYDIRLQLAAKGIPSSHTVGFEIFNEPKMGATHFQENINYIRAIEGELTRTIKRIDAIKDAKVNIAMPQESIFAREEDEAKASVIVSLWPGKDLSKEQIKAIIFLVSHAVPKLKVENVTVVDNYGRVLSDLIENDEEDIGDIVAIKKRLKREIEKSVESMLSRALGPQKVVVRANVDVETAKIDKKDEIVDPDKVAVVSEHKLQEKTQGYQTKPIGSPGTPTNVPATIRSTSNNMLLNKNKKDTTTNYDITKSYIVTKQNIFKVKKVTVGVLVDGKYVQKIDKNGTIHKEYVPRSKAEIEAFKELVKSAIGYDPKRGDKVTVISIPFETRKVTDTTATQPISGIKFYLLLAIGVLTLLLIGLLVYIFIKRAKAKKAKEIAALAALERQKSEVAPSLAHLHKEEELFNLENEPTYQRILEIGEENPELLSNLISMWIKEEGKK